MILIPELKRIREERSVSLQMITEQAELSYAEIWNAEYRCAAVRDETANALAALLGVDVRHLTGELPVPPPPPDYPSWLPPQAKPGGPRFGSAST